MAQLLETLTKTFPHMETITAMFADSNGIMRGKLLPADALPKLIKEGILLPASVFGTDATGESVAETGLVWDTGDRDFPFMAVPDSFHPLDDAGAQYRLSDPDDEHRWHTAPTGPTRYSWAGNHAHE